MGDVVYFRSYKESNGMIFKHIDAVKVSAYFSKERIPRYRYRLEIVSKLMSGKTVCAVMQNPCGTGMRALYISAKLAPLPPTIEISLLFNSENQRIKFSPFCI